MQGWVFEKTHQPLELREVPEPELTADSVIVDLKASGLCHTDVTILDDPGWMKMTKPPVILGHEGAGVIAQVGADVTGWQVGDRVGICPLDPKTLVAIGGARDGAYAEKVLVPATQLIKLPDNVSFVEGAAATDAGMTSHHALFTLGGAKKGMKVGIIGVGGLGDFAVQMALAAGCEVLVADPKPEAQEIAKKLGVKKVFQDASEFKPEGPELIVDYAGFGSTTAHAVEAVKTDGTIVVVGMGILHSDISTWDLTTRRLKIFGNNGGGIEDIAEVYKFFEAGALKPTLHTIPFAKIGAGLDQLRAGKVSGRLIATQP
ncbi:alcohol dehydrogenase [Ligilactobacillus salitolerans]|uniref:Alcohol dehydrogenase n=1 Tax=Ligilactobacillus salitolerans TaxID=1808352 RepID=A0A401IVE2_9LACO|nr:zinc-binding dehydrogenase [Ligilactobacillus salitolerans]GBG95457.1 alcohol dehydrogenase [Ligilactobacillus salitolerans]